MFIESIVLPFIVGLVTNKTSNELFLRDGLYQVIEELYNKSTDEFNAKYQSAYGGAYDNFLAREENLELVMKTVLSLEDTTEIEFGNTSDFYGNPTPQEVVKDFISIFNENLYRDERLFQYRNTREHHFLTESILYEIKQLKQIRFKKFIKPNDFFNFNADGNVTAIKKLNRDVERVIAALNVSTIVLIESFRGFGKTETLKNVSTSENIVELFDSIIVMRHGVRNIIDALQTEFFQGRKYLIIVDDSELCKEEIKEILNFMKSVGVLSKIIMSVQTYSVEDIKLLISNAGLIKYMEQISLNNWEKEDYIELLRMAAQVTEYIDEDIVVAKYPSPTLIKWIGEKKAAADKTSVEVLFRGYKELLKNDANRILNNYMSREDCDRLLFSLCCAVPFDISDEQCKLINESMKRSHDIKLIIRLLQRGGILRKVGYKYRFYPDIKGDIFFAYSLSDEYDTHILDYWIKHDQSRVLENISEARLVSEMDIEDKLKLLIEEWSRTTGYYGQSKNLEIANYIVSFSPVSVVNLLYCYLDDAQNSNGGSYSRLTTDKFGPVLLKLWRYSDDIEAILNFLCELEVSQLDGIYDNYKVKGLTKDLFSPVKNSPERISISLSILQKWISDDRDGTLEIFKYAASEILKGSHEVTKPIINGIQFGLRVVPLNDEVINMREKCIEIMEYLVSRKFGYRSIEMIESICKQIGNMSFGSSDYEESPLRQVFERERARLIELLGNKLLVSSDVSANIIIERILMHWWAGQYPGCESAEVYLLKFSRDGKYLFAKYYVGVDYRVISFDEIAQVAPSEERWKWFVHEIMHNTNDVRDDSRRIAKMLHHEITSLEALNEFLMHVSKIISNFKQAWSSPNIIDKWSEYNNDLFVDFLQSDNYSDTVGFLKAPILKAVITHSNNQKEKIISSVLQPDVKLSNDEIFALLHIAIDDTLGDAHVVEMINSIIDIYYFEYSGGIIHSLFFIFKNRNRSLLINILLKIVRKYPFNESMVDMMDFLIQQFINDLEVADGFQELKYEILIKMYSFSKLDYHEDKIIETLLRSKEESLEFIENRLMSVDVDKNFQVSLGGFSFLNEFISDMESYRFLVLKLMEFVERQLLVDYDLKSIIKPLFMVGDKDGGFLGTCLLKYFRCEKDTKGVLILMDCFVLSKKTVVDFVDALKYLSDNSVGKQAEKFIYSQRFPDGGWSRGIGQNSPELMNRISLYSEIHELMPFGKLKLTVERCIDYLRKDIDEDLIRDEEILNPR